MLREWVVRGGETVNGLFYIMIRIKLPVDYFRQNFAKSKVGAPFLNDIFRGYESKARRTDSMAILALEVEHNDKAISHSYWGNTHSARCADAPDLK